MTIPQTLTDDLLIKRSLHNSRNPSNVAFYGAFGTGVDDDTDYINDAIDNVSAMGGGPLYADSPLNYYKCNSTINLKYNVQLICNGIFRTSADVALARVVPMSSISGGIWQNVNPTLSEGTPIIHVWAEGGAGGPTLDLTPQGMFRRYNNNGLYDLVVIGPDLATPKGSAIKYDCDGTAATGLYQAIQWFKTRGVNIRFAHKGLDLFSEEFDVGANSFVNGNTFSDIGFDNCFYAIYAEVVKTESANGAVAGNIFNNINFQSRGYTGERVIKLVNWQANRNLFSNIKVWDWASNNSGNVCIETYATGSEINANQFSNANGLYSDEVSLTAYETPYPALPVRP